MWNDLASRAITVFHDGLVGEPDWTRRKDLPDSAIAANKRAVDAYNQRRNDAIERIDECLLVELEGVARRSDARMSA